ncbi:hypothetical protein RCL1_003905 [Eukaryota sp. TZLM3-RCL]
MTDSHSISRKRTSKVLDESSSTSSLSVNPLNGKPFSGRYNQILERRKELPVYSFKEEILSTVRDNQVTVLVGETGSGKTTQVPQFILFSDLLKNKCVCCTQPRRVAATSVAERVAEETDTAIGEYVGYSIRFESVASDLTSLFYLTDGILLREIMTDPLLTKYSVIIIDEAHERTVATDVLLGVLKALLPKRPDLKLLVMSATLNSEKFVSYFDNAPLLEVPGRLFPVEINYLDRPTSDYFESAIETVVKIHQTEPPGDVLLFLTGEEEIEEACSRLQSTLHHNQGIGGPVKVLPLYAALPSTAQYRIFEPAPKRGRKIVVSTNIAETSLTIDGVVYVVDPGFCKQKHYLPRTRVESLPITPISKASARQRSGRAGRTQPGKCFRLYTEKSFNEKLKEQTIPEMLRSNIASVVLQMLRLGIRDLIKFDYPDAPHPEALMRALEVLAYIGALDDNAQLTQLGQAISELPLDPQLSKMIVCGCEFGCGNEMIILAACLSVPQIFLRVEGRRKDAARIHEEFEHQEGDHLALINVFYEFQLNNSPEWCKEKHLSHRSLKQAERIKLQLEGLVAKLGFQLTSPDFSSPDYYNLIRKALTGGFFMQVAHLYKKGKYLTIKDNQEVVLHPSTCLSGEPKWVVFNEFVKTSQHFIRTVTVIDPKWLLELAPLYYDADSEDFPDSPAKTDLIMLQKYLSK